MRLCADINGFSLHTAGRCGADERQSLEQLCRYVTHPALANERVQCNAAGQVVVLKLKTPWRDGTTHLVMSPLKFMQRPAALIARPRLPAPRMLARRAARPAALRRPIQGIECLERVASASSAPGLQPFAQSLLPAGPQDALNDRIRDFAAADGRQATSAVL